MGTKYSGVVVSGYNVAPPSDAGAQTDENKIKWSYHKTKIGDPLNTAITAINAALVNAFDAAAVSKTSNYTVLISDYGRTIETTGTTTISLPDAASAGTGYFVKVVNVGTAVVTVGRVTSGNTINAVAQNVTLNPGQGAEFVINAAQTGYLINSLNTLGHAYAQAGGTNNAITITSLPAAPALAAGQSFLVRIGSANTGTVTLNPNSAGAKAVLTRGGLALVAGVLQTGDLVEFVYDQSVDSFKILAARPGTNYDITSLESATSAPVLESLPGVTSGSVFRKNIIINGAMRVAQRGTSFAAIANSAYSLDRWVYGKTGTMVHTLSQDSDVPTVAQAGVLFTNSLRFNLTTADTAIAAGDVVFIQQPIEGYNFQRIAQRAFTASFWVKATAAGVYSASFRNSGTNRSYVSNFTIFVSNTWEKKIINVPATPSAGTWNYTNGVGLFLDISLAVGTTYHTTAGVWQTGNFLGTASNINGVNTGATDFRIVGVQVDPGSVATEFDMVDIEAEFSAAQRYYWKSFPYATAPVQNSGVTAGAQQYRVSNAGVTQGGSMILLPVVMRDTPSFTFFNPVAANANWRNVSLGADSGAASANNAGDRSFLIENPQVAGDLAGHLVMVHAVANAEL